jgi:hypothetical protein
MRVIFEPIDKVEYLELILTPAEIGRIGKKGVVAEFPETLLKGNVLNIFIRQEDDEDILEEEEATLYNTDYREDKFRLYDMGSKIGSDNP